MIGTNKIYFLKFLLKKKINIQYSKWKIDDKKSSIDLISIAERKIIVDDEFFMVF